jgi:hypothetical protein
MIEKLDGFNPIINKNSLYIYEKTYIPPSETRMITLPYIIPAILHYSWANFQISQNLAKLGVLVLWNNLNEESSKEGLTFLLKNLNMVDYNNISSLEQIIGSNLQVELKPNMEFGKIYFIR